ncbi:MFS transporter [Serratia sp. 1D1416]|uniref:MFS transporter n=1 Tax=Serratia sp. 1D1416 TaxID=2447890 RepID=UPI001F5D8D6B|nr:MFS transporter [Serratia sp. 1D1416]
MNKSSGQRSTLREENRLLVILFFVFGCVFVDRLTISFLFPMIAADLQLSNVHLGTLSAVLALTWALSGAGLGAIADRFDIRKPMLIVSILVFSLFSALSGLVSGFAMLLIFRALMGIAEGPVLPIAQSLMVEKSQPQRRGFNMGMIQGAAPGLLGGIIAPPLIIYLAQTWGWSMAFHLTAVPGVILAWLIYKNVNGKKDPAFIAVPAAKAPAEKGAYRQLFNIKNVVLCILISCVFVTWFMVIITFTPSLLVTDRGFGEGAMGGVMSAIGAAWVFWGVAVPAISDRLGRKPTLIFFSLLAICCPLFLSYVDNLWLLGGLVFLSYTGLGCFTLFMATIPSETVSPARIATALGLVMGIGEVIGGCLAPFIAGLLADRYGLVSVMWLAAIGAACAGVLSCFLDETAPAVLSRRALKTEGVADA